MYLTLGARAKQFITLAGLLGLLLGLGGITARRTPDVKEKAARKLVTGRNATGQISQELTTVRTPNSGSLASTAHNVSVMFCKVLQFLAHYFLSLSCFCLVHEHNWLCKMIQKHKGQDQRKLAEPGAGFQLLFPNIG